MNDQIKYSQRLEIRLSTDEMGTLNKMSNDRKVSRSSFIRALIEKERKSCDQRETDIATLKNKITVLEIESSEFENEAAGLKNEIIKLETDIKEMRKSHGKMIG